MTTTPAPRDARPIPPRFWWLKRILLVGAALLVALGALRWWWGREAQWRLDAKIAEYRAAGQPVNLTDFDPAPLADEENAATALKQAHSLLAAPPDGLLNDILSSHAFCEQHKDELHTFIAAHAKSLRFARQARAHPRADWGFRFRSPAIFGMLPDLSPQRALGKLLCAAAIHTHHTGNDAETIELLRDALHCGDMTDQPPSTILSHLVTVAIHTISARTIEHIVPGLALADSSTTTSPSASPATLAQIRQLIATLLEEEGLRENWRQAMYGERASLLDCVDMLLRGRITTAGINTTAAGTGAGVPTFKPTIGFLFGPFWNLDALYMAEYSTAYADAGAASDWPAAQSLRPADPDFDSGIDLAVHFLSNVLLPTFDPAMEHHFVTVASRRMAAIALAIRLYELDHGRRPATLAELVPTYLQIVPRDPFAADGHEIGYRPLDPQPVLYSVGLDGKDDAGRVSLKANGTTDRQRLDLPFFLNGVRPSRRAQQSAASAPSTQTAEDRQDVEPGQRQEQ